MGNAIDRRRAAGVILARGGSERLPRKHVMVVGGSPVIAHTIRAALGAVTLDGVYVSTDSEEIAAVATFENARVIDRPLQLATSTASMDEALRHAVEVIERATGPLDVVVCMQGNVPVRKAGEIDEVVERLIATPAATTVATAYRVTQRPEWMKRLVPGTFAISPLMDAGTNYRMQDLPDLFLLDGATIAIRVDTLKATAGDRRVHAYMGTHTHIVVHDEVYATELDEPDDVELAEFFLSGRGGRA